MGGGGVMRMGLEKEDNFSTAFYLPFLMLANIGIATESQSIITKKTQSAPSLHCDFTHHDVNQIRNVVDERPYPFAVGCWVKGAGRQADNRASRALLGVHLHKK